MNQRQGKNKGAGMTKELIYEGSLIRVEQAGDERVTPVADIAKAIGYESQVLTRLVRRDPVLKFYEVAMTAMVDSPKGGQFVRNLICLKKEGVTGLLIKINSVKIKDKAKREKVQRFQTWALEGKLAPVPGPDAYPEGLNTLLMAMAQNMERQSQMMMEQFEQTAALTEAVTDLAEATASMTNQVAALSDRVCKLETEAKTEPVKPAHGTEPMNAASLEAYFANNPEVLAHVSRDVRLFLAQACSIDPDGAVNMSYLYMVYENWAASNCQFPVGRNNFYEQVRKATSNFGKFVLQRTKIYLRGLKMFGIDRRPGLIQ